jgi:hypothetical protein
MIAVCLQAENKARRRSTSTRGGQQPAAAAAGGTAAAATGDAAAAATGDAAAASSTPHHDAAAAGSTPHHEARGQYDNAELDITSKRVGTAMQCSCWLLRSLHCGLVPAGSLMHYMAKLHVQALHLPRAYATVVSLLNI